MRVNFSSTGNNGPQGLFQFNPAVRRSAAMVVIWLVIVNGFALVAFNRLNLAPDTAFRWIARAGITPPAQSWEIVDIHSRWDSYWYLDIVKEGYYLRGEKGIANVVFFPLYPFLIRAAAPLAGGDPVLAGWMVSSVFLVLAAAVLVRLTQRFHPEIDPLMPILFLLAYPTAFILNAVYSESLFLFLSLAAVYYAREEKFLIASLFVAFASATRIAGLFLCVLLLVEFIQSRGWKSLFSRRVWPLFIAPSGAFGFFLYHWAAFGNFFLYLKIQNNWGRDFEFAAADYMVRNSPYWINMVTDLSFMAMVIVIGLLALKRLRISYGLYMLVSMGIALSTGTFLATTRYSMMLFPIYLMAAAMGSVLGRGSWMLISVLLLAMNIIAFLNHYWVG